MKIRFIILTIWASVSYLSAGAQTLTLTEARSMALKNNVNVAMAQAQRVKADYDEKQYRSNFLPNFKLVGGALYNSWSRNEHYGLENNAAAAALVQQIVSFHPQLATMLAGFNGFDINAKTGLVYTGGLTMTQPIYMGGKITAAHNMSKIAQQMTRENQTLTANEVIVNTDEAYVLCVKAKEMQQVAVKYNEMLKELLRVVESGRTNGMVPQNDVLRVQVKLNESELAMTKAENAIRLAKMNLCHMIGMDLNAAIDVENEFPENAVIANAAEGGVQNRPEFNLLQEQVSLADQQIKLSKSDYLPNVALIMGGNYLNGLQLNDKTLFDKMMFNALVTVSVPLFHFGEGSNKVKSAKVQKNLAEMQQRDLTEKMELELAQARNNMDEAQKEVQLTQRSLAQADENLRQTASQYKNGMATLADNLEAQALWQTAYENHVESKFQDYLMRTKYLKAAGLLK